MTYNLRLNWNPEDGDDYNIPCGTVRVTTSWHLNAIDLVYAVSQPKERSTAADTPRRLIKKKLFDESDITHVVHSQYKETGIISFARAIKLLMVLGGITARVEREKFARVLHLFYAGDAELKAEIDSNAISQEWLAREALSAEIVAATDHQLVPAGGTSNADRHAASAGALPLLRKTRGNIQQTGLSQTGRSDEGGHSNTGAEDGNEASPPPHPPFPSLFSSLSPCDEAPSPLCQNCSPSRSDVREGEGEESPTGPRARAHPARSCPATQPSQALRLVTRKPPLPLPPPLQVPKKGGREGEGERLREMCHLSPADDGTVTVIVAGVSCFNSKLKRLA